MKSLFTIAAGLLVFAITAPTEAGSPRLPTITLGNPAPSALPDPAYAPHIAPQPEVVYGGPVYEGMPVAPQTTIFTDVKYRAERKIDSCAVPTFLCVPNPCYDKCDPCSNPCVLVEVCVPPCKVARIKVRRRGDKLIYDYGRQEVTVTVRKRDIVVRYS